MLYYSALLQLPDVFSSKKPAVDDAIAAMSLGDYADKLIGGHCFAKRLPTGERRRVSIARELVMRPHVLFIDEPLYHLDRFVSPPACVSASKEKCLFKLVLAY
jgi:ABC-type multidrug transport system ATPase subunit